MGSSTAIVSTLKESAPAIVAGTSVPFVMTLDIFNIWIGTGIGILTFVYMVIAIMNGIKKYKGKK